MGAMNLQVESLAVLPNGNVLAAGRMGSAFMSTPPYGVLRWDGTSWGPLPSYPPGRASFVLGLSRGDFLVKTSVVNAPTSVTLSTTFWRWNARGLCPPDYNCSGGVDVSDVFDFLNGWLVGDSWADFNASGALDGLDIFDFVNSWFAGC